MVNWWSSSLSNLTLYVALAGTGKEFLRYIRQFKRLETLSLDGGFLALNERDILDIANKRYWPLKSLGFPLGSSPSTLFTLIRLLQTYPNLTYLRLPLSPSDSTVEFPKIVSPARLRTLSTGTATGRFTDATDTVFGLACFLDKLFPHLEKMDVHEWYSPERWMSVFRMIRKFQENRAEGFAAAAKKFRVGQ